jgi:hypothetical protein
VLCVELICHVHIVISVVSSLCVGRKDATNATTRRLHGTGSRTHGVEMFALPM